MRNAVAQGIRQVDFDHLQLLKKKVYFSFKTSFKKELYKIIVVYEALVCYYAELLMSQLCVFAWIRHLREQYMTGLMPINSNKSSAELFRGNRHGLLGEVGLHYISECVQIHSNNV